MRKIKMKSYYNSITCEFMNQITMTTDENHYYVLWDAEAMLYDGQNPLFKGAKNINEENIMFANLALESKGHKHLTAKEAEWMLEHIESDIRQS